MYMYNISPIVLKTLGQNKDMLEYACKGDKKLIASFYAQLSAVEKREASKEELSEVEEEEEEGGGEEGGKEEEEEEVEEELDQ